jgi:hypothetical protein
MTPDGLTPDASAHVTLRPARLGWRRDVIDGVTRRFALAALPALTLAIVARTVRGEWDMVALVAVTLAATGMTLSPTGCRRWRGSASSSARSSGPTHS